MTELEKNVLSPFELKKLKSEVEKLECELTRIMGHKPTLENDRVYQKGFAGIGECEICGTTTEFNVVLKPNSTEHLWCPKCQEKVYDMQMDCHRKIMRLRK